MSDGTQRRIIAERDFGFIALQHLLSGAFQLVVGLALLGLTVPFMHVNLWMLETIILFPLFLLCIGVVLWLGSTALVHAMNNVRWGMPRLWIS